MARKTRGDEVVNKDLWEPTRDEIMVLRKEIEATQPIRAGGRLQSRLDTLASQKGFVRFDEYGNTIVRDAIQYHQLSEMNEKVRKWQWHDQETVFKAFPEEREKHQNAIKKIMSNLADKFKIK